MQAGVMPPAPDSDLARLKTAIEYRYGGLATFVQSVAVGDQFGGGAVWCGAVHVFDMVGHPTATRAYGWSTAGPGKVRRLFALLHRPPIDSAQAAVSAAFEIERQKRPR
jgi:hypothetical protein